MVPEIHIEDYNYPLPDDRIAKYPLPQRDASRLLHYENGRIASYIFRDLPSLLPPHALMVFNDTRVVPARLHFLRESGAHIEVFCLEPVDPVEYNLAFACDQTCCWKCVLGNAKRWKGDVLRLRHPGSDPRVEAMELTADLLERAGQTGVVRFTWKGRIPFSQVLELCGNIPIPPYLCRETEEIDLERYQTLYARVRGSVAAPTAGLHFTQPVLDAIRERGIETENVCLHVGAGTFLPVKTSDVREHPMHREPFSVSLSLLRKLRRRDRRVVAVGTTSVRTLESLYYLGVSIIERGAPSDVPQWAPYTRTYPYSTEEALDAIIGYLEERNAAQLTVGTRIIIVPGFRFRLTDGMVTNFHQPESTLLLLVSAFVGGDWRSIYRYALDGGFRFLSYGDSSYLVRVPQIGESPGE